MTKIRHVVALVGLPVTFVILTGFERYVKEDPIWKAPLQGLFKEERTCTFPARGKTRWACNIFVGKAVEIVYGVKDFQANGGWLRSNDIADSLSQDKWKQWEFIGVASDSSAVEAAVAYAKSARAVIAVWKNPNSGVEGHVALIIPRDIVGAGKSLAPCAAQFRLGHPADSWIGRSLRQSFGSDKWNSVKLYARTDLPGAAWPSGPCEDWTPPAQ